MSRTELDRWCPERVGDLATGEGISCGKFASILREDGKHRCPEHADTGHMPEHRGSTGQQESA